MPKPLRPVLPRDVHGWASLVTEALAIPGESLPLPRHFVMRELHSGKTKSFATNVSMPNESAVLLLLNPVQDRSGIASDVADVCIPLTMRSGNMRTHKGQMSLPGGRCDKGETAEMAAFRETREEIGVDASAYTHLGTQELTPTVASPDEVESLHYLHLSPLLESSEQTHFTLAKRFSTSGTGNVSFPCFFASASVSARNTPHRSLPAPLPGGSVLTPVRGEDCDGSMVWGLTAFVLCEFIARLAAVVERHAGMEPLSLLRASPWIVRDPDHPDLNVDKIPAKL
jgi:8-oxo-dGTP pyrophosphatase MutT (NUDIX family)